MLNQKEINQPNINITNTGRALTQTEYWDLVESKAFMAHIDYMNIKFINKDIISPKVYRWENDDE